MKTISDASHPPAEEGMSIRIKLSEVDRDPCDSQSIIGCIMKKTDDVFFQVGTRNIILKSLNARSQFSVCSKKIFNFVDIPR